MVTGSRVSLSRSVAVLALQGEAGTRLVDTPMLPNCMASIIVPARDEAVGIVATLAALAGQVDHDGRQLDPRTYEIILLANNCDDDTAAQARRFALQHPRLALHVIERILPQREAHVGMARRLLMEEAAQRFRDLAHPAGVIVSTDADTLPEPTWLHAILAAIAEGADAVGGRILTDLAGRAALPVGARQAHLRDVGYRSLVAEVESLLDPSPSDPWPRHYQHFGASLALTADAYQKVGGLLALPALEDVALSIALVLADARLRHSPNVRVFTSARTVARNLRGFSTQFQEWGALHAARKPVLVESAASAVTRARQRGQLRALWHAARRSSDCPPYPCTALSDELALPAAWLVGQASIAATFGQFELQVARRQGKRLPFDALGPLQPIEVATRELRPIVAELRRRGPVALPACEEVDPIGLQALPAEMIEEVTVTVQEFLVDLVAVQRGIVDRRGPVDQQEVAAAG